MEGAFFLDDHYRDVGMEVVSDPYPGADVVLVVGRRRSRTDPPKERFRSEYWTHSTPPTWS